MISIRTKLIIASVVLAGAVAYLAIAGAKSGWVYYMEVDSFIKDNQYHAQRVRLHGKVAQEDFSFSAASLLANFKLQGKSEQLAVAYTGSIPDMFEVGRDVVVEGRLNEAGVFQADVLMTKCASKYEPGSPHSKTHDSKTQEKQS